MKYYLIFIFLAMQLNAHWFRQNLLPQDSISIQSRIDNALSGDTIYLTRPEYTECIQIKKSVTLIGRGIDKTKITGNTLKPVITINAIDAVIKNLTISAKLKTQWDS